MDNFVEFMFPKILLKNLVRIGGNVPEILGLWVCAGKLTST